jgi:hypothetical protein
MRIERTMGNNFKNVKTTIRKTLCILSLCDARLASIQRHQFFLLHFISVPRVC